MATTRTQRLAAFASLLSLAGLLLTGYLTYLHLGLMRGELLGGMACGGGGALNCHAVTASPWGSFLGIPLSIIGLFGYGVLLSLSLYALQDEETGRPAIRLIAALSLAAVGVDVYLFYIMATVIKHFCLFCLGTYAVNILLFLITTAGLGTMPFAALSSALSDVARLWPSGKRPASFLLAALVGLSFTASAGIHTATLFVSKGTLKSQSPQIREYFANQPRVSVNTDGDPVKGNPDGRIRLVEFSDFQCPVCQKASRLNNVILAAYRKDVALVFKNYPLDMSCNPNMPRALHEGACRIAIASECAHKQGKFWPFHDKVFAQTPPYNPSRIEEDARSIGLGMEKFGSCLSSGEGLEAVKRDIDEGSKTGVTSTPTFTLNDVLIRGLLSPATFEDFVQALDEPQRSQPHDHKHHNHP